MPDMLVKLYELPNWIEQRQKLTALGVEVRRAIAPEKHHVVAWVHEQFGATWASETEVAFSNHPISCFIGTNGNQIVGFACYDATCRGFFGPTGVQESERGRGIGRALLLMCLDAMAVLGYGYAIIGAAGPQEFYSKAVGATPIDGSWPGIYRGMIHE